jgi:hypothetical protein
MDKVSQNNKVLEYMENYGSITSREAMMRLNVMRLASRICDLKKKGYPIVTDMETSTNGVRYARYSLERVS